MFGPVNAATGDVPLTEHISGLQPNTAYRWVLCGSANNGGAYACAGPNGKFGSTTADPPPDYETFTTAAWSVVPSENAMAPGGILSGVSCSGATACTAVGSYTDSTGTRVPLAERWDGTSWTIQPTPTAPGGSLSGVSCPSATACVAVGSTGSSGTLAEHWDGTSWTIQPTPNPTGAVLASLSGVSCTSASACTAVGSYFTGTEFITLAERWDGTTWTIQTTPSGGSELYGVSCTSATACTAVGSGAGGPLAERWDGTTWTIQPTPAGSGILSGVSCTSATACTAVGSSGSGTLAERWDGTSWTIQPTPNPTGAMFASLSGVSCTSATACTAVGNWNSGNDTTTQMPLAERWDGTAWTIQATPNPTGAQDISLSGVSCTSATACSAAGNYFDSTRNALTLAERWDGTSWTIQTTPNPTGLQSSVLSSVSCTSATACAAVGNYQTGAGLVTLAERWDGTAWTIQATPNPTGGGSLAGVSCTSATACTAVGSSGGATLAERWDGTSWTIQTTPNPAGAQGSSLSGVSCTSATACTAVGYYTNSANTQVTLAERWDGTSWTIQTTPNPTGAPTSALSGVSCTSATACTAVGNYTSGGIGATLAERWDGTSWTIQSTPNPGGAESSFLAALSCTSATACTAVGGSINSTGGAPLAERWDGTAWMIQSTPNPTQYSLLEGVWCPSATACAAVGYSIIGGELTLAERYQG